MSERPLGSRPSNAASHYPRASDTRAPKAQLLCAHLPGHTEPLGDATASTVCVIHSAAVGKPILEPAGHSSCLGVLSFHPGYQHHLEAMADTPFTVPGPVAGPTLRGIPQLACALKCFCFEKLIRTF